MKPPVELARLRGCCIVDHDGGIGFIDHAGNVSADAELNEALGEHARSVLAGHLGDPDSGRYRIGLLYGDTNQPWSAPTLLFEADVVRTLFPIAGPRSAQLTNFQRRNRYRSVYQAFEILLAYRRHSMPGVPVYCPALLDRGTVLSDYSEALAPDVAPCDARCRVLEVVNLIEGMTHGERRSDAVRRLSAKLHEGVVHPEVRRAVDLGLVDEVDTGPDAGDDADDPYGDVRRRHEESIDISHVPEPPDARSAPTLSAVRAPLQLGPALLRRFTTFEHFDVAALEKLAAHLTIHDAPAGACLVNAGTIDEWNYYLVEGTLALRAIDNESTLLRAGSEPARAPVARLLPRYYTVTASTPVRYLRVHQALLREAQGAASGCPVPGLETGERHALQQALERGLASGTYVLPGPPAVEAAVRGALQHDSDEEATLVHALADQPAVAAGLVHAANLAAYRGAGDVADLTGAIARLGAGSARDLTIAFALKELFDAVPRDERERADAAWMRSTQLAAHGFALARATPGFVPARALLCGLVYDVGTVAIIGYALRHPEIARGPGDLDAAIAQLRGAVGACLLRRWQLSEEIARAALEADYWFRDPGTKADYCDLVLVSRLQCAAGTDQAADLPRPEEVPAVRRLLSAAAAEAPGLDAMRGNRAEIEAVQQLLRA